MAASHEIRLYLPGSLQPRRRNNMPAWAGRFQPSEPGL